MEDLFHCIYEDLQGVHVRPMAPFPVENIFAEGTVCDRLYGKIFENKIKICDRLGVDEDADLEEICSCFFDIMEVMCRKMFDYGKAELS